jgi:hypothetical protein
MDRRKEFLTECRAYWEKAISDVIGPIPPTSSTWHGLDRIKAVLQHFVGSNRNHGHYPTGGGMDFHSVENAGEVGCLSISLGDRMADIVKPLSMTLEHFIDAPGESFIILELDKLSPVLTDHDYGPDKEPALEYPLGTYRNIEFWERGYLNYDSNGREIPLPVDSRGVTRWLGGKILIVSKGSLWNGTPATYRGQHNKMTNAQIRGAIESALRNSQ